MPIAASTAPHAPCETLDAVNTQNALPVNWFECVDECDITDPVVENDDDDDDETDPLAVDEIYANGNINNRQDNGVLNTDVINDITDNVATDVSWSNVPPGTSLTQPHPKKNDHIRMRSSLASSPY